VTDRQTDTPRYEIIDRNSAHVRHSKEVTGLLVSYDHLDLVCGCFLSCKPVAFFLMSSGRFLLSLGFKRLLEHTCLSYPCTSLLLQILWR